MTRATPDSDLSRRERQIMAVLHRRGSATVAEIGGEIPAPPTGGALRTLLGILERKGQVTKRREGRRTVYKPRVATSKAARSAFRSLVDTFFAGSFHDAVAAHLADPSARLDEEDYRRLSRLIREARKGKR